MPSGGESGHVKTRAGGQNKDKWLGWGRGSSIKVSQKRHLGLCDPLLTNTQPSLPNPLEIITYTHVRWPGSLSVKKGCAQINMKVGARPFLRKQLLRQLTFNVDGGIDTCGGIQSKDIQAGKDFWEASTGHPQGILHRLVQKVSSYSSEASKPGLNQTLKADEPMADHALFCKEEILMQDRTHLRTLPAPAWSARGRGTPVKATEVPVEPSGLPAHVCVCACACVCARARVRACACAHALLVAQCRLQIDARAAYTVQHAQSSMANCQHA
eukprot:1159338-Pelagomonas_calceolata.AAC.20